MEFFVFSKRDVGSDIFIDCTWKNFSTIVINMFSNEINSRWSAIATFWFNLKGGNKQKEKLVLKINDLGISSLDDIESLSISFRLLYAQYAITTDEVNLELK